MRTYRFMVSKGQFELVRTIEAIDNDDFYIKLAKLEKDGGAQLVRGTIMCTISEIMHIPDPPAKSEKPTRAFTPEETELANRIGMP